MRLVSGDVVRLTVSAVGLVDTVPEGCHDDAEIVKSLDEGAVVGAVSSRDKGAVIDSRGSSN